MSRRHDIDALRALAFAGVMLYHLGMYYVADWGWHLKSPHAAHWLQWPMRAVNLWRLDLVFLISGVALGFLRGGPSGLASLRQRSLNLFRQRSLRLLLPLAFGMAVAVPYQPYAQGVANGLVAPGFAAFLARYYTGGPWPHGAFDGWREGITWNHLWYLAYLWVYTTLLALLLPVLESAAGRRLRQAFSGLRGVWLLLVPALPLLLYSLTLWPRFAPTHDLLHDGWLHAVYFTLFLYGYWIGLDEGFWVEAARLRWRHLGLAAALLAVLMTWHALAGPTAATAATAVAPGALLRFGLRWVADLYVWSTLLAILGWAHHKLNRPQRWLPWAGESVYPWYVLHQTLIIVAVVWLAPLGLGPVLEPLALLAATVLGCWSITALVRRSRWLRPLLGLKPRAPLQYPSQSTPACPAARSA